MTTTSRIRPMRPTDAARVAELATQLGYPSTAEEVTHRLEELAAHPRAVALVAVDDADEAIGWIQVERTPSLAVSDTALIGGLVVDEGRRSATIGARLVAAAEDWARDQGARTMTLSSRTTRERAHRFYEELGYVETKRSHVFGKPLV